MRPVVVCDASAIVAMLLDDGSDGAWAAGLMMDADLAAPALMPFEAADVVRHQEMAGLVSSDQAAQAHADLLDLDVELWPYDLLAVRAWELRENLSTSDASSVALAESLGATLMTLDRRIARASGPRCVVVTPEA